MSEPHEVVKLLLARMESHPEEFRLKDPSYHDRWYNHMSAINTHGNEADKAALAGKIREIRLAEIHEQVMDELLNGEDRRAQEEKENEYERHLKQSLQHMKQRQQMAAQNNQLQPYGQALGLAPGQYSQANQNAMGNIMGRSPTNVIMDEYANIGIGNGGTGATRLERVKKLFSK